DIYLAGGADSPDFPVSEALQPSIGGLADAFVAKMSSDGSTIIYSTFLGGSDDDVATGVAVDDRGQVYVTGFTLSHDFPLRRPLQRKLKGVEDGFISKINSSGSRLVFSTYFGGDGEPLVGGLDRPQAIAVDSSYKVWITGFTNSTIFPLVRPLQDSIKGNFDAFVLKLNRRGSKILFSSYLGGSSSDNANSISLDTLGNAYVAGRTHSQDFPVMQSLQQFNKGTIGDDAFVTVITGSGAGLIFSSFLGGTNQESASAIKVFGEFINVCGSTSSYDFPLVNPFQSQKKGNFFSNDAFVAKISLVP
ncbi:SBBP repeat-containing protein, partial [bacterium]|nr:SBBP repeat-containing protein [bacterium]